MMLALNLAALGVRSTIINRETGPRWHPKGSTQNARTMEHYRRLGIVDAVRAVGLPRDLPTDVTISPASTAGSLPASRCPPKPRSSRHGPRLKPTTRRSSRFYRCNQMHAEAVLFDQVQACALIDSATASMHGMARRQ